MSRIEEYKLGAWSYDVEHKFEKYHTGFWHKLGCHPVETVTKTRDNDPWHTKIYRYECGYEKVVKRFRNKEDE